MCSGTAVTTMVSSYIQDNVGWGLGFGIPCLVMVFALLMFLLGTRNYRYYTATESSPFARLASRQSFRCARQTLQIERV